MRSMPIALGGLAAAGLGLLAAVTAGAQPDDGGAARYDGEGRMLFPADYREWVFVTAGRGMSYAPIAAEQPAPPFDNVFVDRAAYRHFLEHGTWPDGTVLVLEIRGGTSHGSILEAGSFQTGEPLAVEVHVKDTPRFGGDGWAFFGFGGREPATMVPREASCYSCHEANAAADRTFVQFYPTLLPIARAKGTLSPGYLAQEAAERDASGS
jgi:hypothetical protein